MVVDATCNIPLAPYANNDVYYKNLVLKYIACGANF
jgi:hypothetical protein